MAFSLNTLSTPNGECQPHKHTNELNIYTHRLNIHVCTYGLVGGGVATPNDELPALALGAHGSFRVTARFVVRALSIQSSKSNNNNNNNNEKGVSRAA